MTTPVAPKTSPTIPPERAPAIAIVDLERDLVGLIVADTPERLWTDVQHAIDRRRAASPAAVSPAAAPTAAAPPRRDGPKDFASAMRCVEREVYDLP